MVGFVWQQTGRNLLPYLTARGERRAADAAGRRAVAAGPPGERARELLELVGRRLLRATGGPGS